jgi:hypothetical protein
VPQIEILKMRLGTPGPTAVEADGYVQTFGSVMEGRQRSGHCRVRRDARRDPGHRSWHNPTDWFQRQHCVLASCQQYHPVNADASAILMPTEPLGPSAPVSLVATRQKGAERRRVGPDERVWLCGSKQLRGIRRPHCKFREEEG